jgi:carboxymethylenebutenolidase
MALSDMTIGTVKVDGMDMDLFSHAPASTGPSPAVIVIQEIFGVNDHTKGITARFAAEGYFSVAPDLFHRSGRNVVVPFSDIPRGFALRQQLDDDDIVADLKEALNYLASLPEVDNNRIGIVGYCFGGMVSFLASARVKGIRAAAIYYGGGIVPRPGTPDGEARLLDQLASGVQCPIIGFWGNQDDGIPVDSVKEIEDVLRGNGKSIETNIYEGAGHGFFCEERDSYHAGASQDAWSKTISFFNKHL